jgi:hypothetical protein
MAYAGERIVRQFGVEITVFDTLDIEVSLGDLRAQLDAMIALHGADAMVEIVKVISRGREEPSESQEFRIRI